MDGKLGRFIYPCLLLCFIEISLGATFGNETDRTVLLAFKEFITDDPLGLISSWNDSTHFCNWSGVTCGRKHQRVVALDLQSQKLVGKISPFIGNLSFLRSIQLQENQFSGNIPQELSHLSKLQYLNLSYNVLQGEIPSNLSRLLELEIIDLTQNGLVGNIPESVGSLSNLTLLSLFSNHLHGRIPPSLGNLSLIKTISLGENLLEGTIPDSIGRLNNLQLFGFGTNNISGTIPPSLFNISSLRVLATPQNQLTGSLPSDIGLTLPNLRRVSIATNNFSGPFPVSFSNASNLEVLNLGYNNIEGPVPDDLAIRMVNLNWLQLGPNNLGTGDGRGLSFLDSLSNCTLLQRLSFDRNNFGGIIPESITNLSTKLRYLYAQDNQFTGEIPEGLSKYVNLLVLILDNNFLSGSIPSSIGKLQGLQGLSLSGNRLSGPIPTSIGNLEQLFALDLSRNELSGSIPSSFRNVQGLQILNFSNNHLYGPISEVIGSFSTLLSMDFSRNSFNGSLPPEIGSLNVINIVFSSNKFSGEIPNTLGKCLALEMLCLDSNMLQGNIHSSLGSLKSIKLMDLSNNNLSGAIPVELENLPLEYLNLSFNSLQGQVPSEGIFKNATFVSVFGNKNLCGGVKEFHLSACATEESNKKRNRTVIASVCAAAGLVLVALLFYLWWKTKSPKASSRAPQEALFGEDFLRVSYNDLFKATEGFSSSNLIGVGSFGSVYKGILLPDERLVAVKVFNLEQIGASKSFMVECEALRKTRHRNLLKIITACSSTNFQGENFKALVFEFMTNGSLEGWLHPSEDMLSQRENLNLFSRLNIAIDVASALEYLHQDCEEPIVHCDLKPSNVLLNEHMNAHVGDFGLARFLALSFSSGSMVSSQSIAIRGSIGYLPPEYGMGRAVSTEGDVYSYGILLLEMVTGKRPTNDMFTEGKSLHNWCKMSLRKQGLEIVDPSLLLDENPTEAARARECLISLLKLGVACSAEFPDERMNASTVLNELNRIKRCFLAEDFTVQLH